jgi:ABC-2 type transport system ATP-binding protein
MRSALKLSAVRKRYGRTLALDGLDLDVPHGVICAFVGPNGSGKTTTFGSVAGLIKMDSGRADVLGQGPFDPRRHGGRLTLLPQDCQMGPDLIVERILAHYARLQGLSGAAVDREVARRLDEVALTQSARARFKELSHGMRRRVAIAQALLGEPELVLLDEPTSGLDPELVLRMRELFAAQRGQRTLVISSHNLLELETICDHVLFIERGRCVRGGSMAEVTQRGLLLRYRLEEAVDPAQFNDLAVELALRWNADEASLVAEAPHGWSAAQLNERLVPRLLELGVGLLEIRQGQSLEAAYMAQKSEAAKSTEAAPT